MDTHSRGLLKQVYQCSYSGEPIMEYHQEGLGVEGDEGVPVAV